MVRRSSKKKEKTPRKKLMSKGKRDIEKEEKQREIHRDRQRS